MAATLSISFSDAGATYAQYYAQLQQSLQNDFAAWLGHFDVTSGTVALTVAFKNLNGAAADGGSNGLTKVGVAGTRTVYESSVGAQLGFGSATAPVSAQIDVDTAYLAQLYTSAANPNPIYKGDDTRTFEHEFGHILGLIGYAAPVSGTLPAGFETTYDRYIQVSGGTAVFTGLNAESAYGGRPVPLEVNSGYHPYVAGKISVMSYLDSASSIQDLDVDLLKDTGLPILTDREVWEHTVDRLYIAAFGRPADPGALVADSNALAKGTSVHDIAVSFVAASEFTTHFGTAGDTKTFVDLLYQQALHRTADPTGEANAVAALNGGALSRPDFITSLANSDENRVALNASPNVSYSNTVEAEVGRLYETMFLRGGDPAGFAGFTTAMINGTTIGQVAAQFITSAEFATNYGSGVSNEAFTRLLYTNTLNRMPAASELAGWVGALQGGYSRADEVVGFSDSHEHIANLAKAVVVGGAGSTAAYTAVPLGFLPTHSIPIS